MLWCFKTKKPFQFYFHLFPDWKYYPTHTKANNFDSRRGQKLPTGPEYCATESFMSHCHLQPSWLLAIWWHQWQHLSEQWGWRTFQPQNRHRPTSAEPDRFNYLRNFRWGVFCQISAWRCLLRPVWIVLTWSLRDKKLWNMIYQTRGSDQVVTLSL